MTPASLLIAQRQAGKRSPSARERRVHHPQSEHHVGVGQLADIDIVRSCEVQSVELDQRWTQHARHRFRAVAQFDDDHRTGHVGLALRGTAQGARNARSSLLVQAGWPTQNDESQAAATR